MRIAGAWVLALVVGGCASGSPGATVPSTLVDTAVSSQAPATASSTATVATPPTAAGSETTASSPTRPDDDLVAFVATLEELLAGTPYEGEVLQEPEVFVAIGRLFCERLGAGDPADDVLAAFLAEMAGGVETASDDDLVLAGALLGASVGVLCPEYADALG